MTLEPIGLICTPFKEKFGIPRQASLLEQVDCSITMHAPYNDINGFRGIEDFSHLWVTFGFHANEVQTFKPLIRPPRLGGNAKQGVFASRSPFRPNQLGLSLVQFKGIEDTNGISINISGIDCVDQTPVYDIKPFIAYADTPSNPHCGFASDMPERLIVDWQNVAQHLRMLSIPTFIKQQVDIILQSDPRPAYQDKPEREYIVALFNWQWHFVVEGHTLSVTNIRESAL